MKRSIKRSTDRAIKDFNTWLFGQMGIYGMTREDIGDLVGLTSQCVSLKLSGKSEWYYRQVLALQEYFRKKDLGKGEE